MADSEVNKSRKAYPAMYVMLWPAVVEECRARGYAAALHGSLAKDMDVVAVPWTDEAVPLPSWRRPLLKGWAASTETMWRVEDQPRNFMDGCAGHCCSAVMRTSI